MLRIVVADDMPMQVSMLEETIHRIRPQDAVFTAQNREEVLAITQEREIDLVLSDIRMPCLDGLEMLHRISQTSPDTRVIFITGYALFSYAQRALRETDDFVYEITERCGYMDERYFIRQFQKHYQMSPLTYRRLHRKEPKP